jgi:tRNA (guanine37-N1)-methyltransferase
MLTDFGLLDNRFEFTGDGRTISIPLTRTPNSSELARIKHSISDALVREEEFEPRTRKARTFEDALAGKVPDEILAKLPQSYDLVGDIAIFDIHPSLAKYETELAGAVLEVHTRIKAVFARTGPIEGTERIRPLRHLAGEDRTVTVHREFGCSFKVDLSRVFFSPRLSTEHQRVALQVVEGEQVIDMFTGVGPFSILIAKTVRNVTVDAIDSNPAATELAEENARSNKVDSKVHVYSGDARQIAREIGHDATRVIMNHPSCSKDFVNTACQVLRPSGGVLHYYTFAEGKDSQDKARNELEQRVISSGRSIREVLSLHKVREVAPMRWQIAVDAEIV